jgi:hypothetical protein
MALTSLQGSGRGISFDDYFKQALNLDVAKLEAIIRGQDHSMPIVAAMAAYEVKKPMTTAAAGQQAQQQLQQAQPTVRQEMEQEMDESGMIPDMAMLNQQRMGPQPPVLPEQAGVGALPAPNMEGMSMAHGGIIAFDDGGEVPGYAAGDLMSAVPPPKKSFGKSITERLNKLAEEEGYQRELFQSIDPEKEIAKLQQQLASLPPDSPQRGLIQSRIDALAKMPPKTAPALDESAAETARLQRQAGPAAQPEFIDVSSRGAAARAPASRAARTGAPASAPAPAPAGEAGIAGALKARDALVSGEDREIREKLGQYEKDVATGIEGLRKIREEGKPAGKAYEKYEAQLMKEEEAAKGKEERNLQMALVNAGLAIAGGTSQYALENIGKGALVGTKQYMDGIDKLEAAAKKRQEAAAMIENARRAEERGDWEKKNEFEARAVEMQMGAKKNSIDALSKITGENKRAATDIFNTMETNATRERMAREQNKTELQKAAMLKDVYGGRDERMLMASAQGAAEKEYTQWAKDGLNQTKSAAEKELEKRRIFDRVFRQFGLPSPYAAGATPQGGQRKPLMERTDLFQ